MELLQGKVIFHYVSGNFHTYIAEMPRFINNSGNILLSVGITEDKAVFLTMGIPTAITGLLVWFFKRHLDKRDAEKTKHEKDIEKAITMMLRTSMANYVLIEATAKAVQRIPDAHCNGDMTKALEQAAKIQQAEQKFLMDQGVKHIFGE